MAERQVAIFATADVEPVRVDEFTLVPVGGQQPRCDDDIGGNALPGDFGVGGGNPADLGK